MLKRILRLLIALFLLQSTWAVAAQYCEHELNRDATHFGHHQHQHKADNASAKDQALGHADNQNVPGDDTDCPYCHLGAMKSMPAIHMTPIAVASPLLPTAVLLTYPHILAYPPERPNWRAAA